MGKTINEITKVCNECDGEGLISSCCGAGVEKFNKTYQCSMCFKFCKTDHCCDGYEKFKIGSKVELFICVYSPKYLRDLLYSSKELGDSKSFKGEIVEFVDNYNALVKIKYRRDKNPIKVDVDNLSLID